MPEFEPDPGKPANVRLLVNDREVGKGHVARTVTFRYGVEPFDIGMDTVSSVSEGRIDQVTIEVK